MNKEFNNGLKYERERVLLLDQDGYDEFDISDSVEYFLNSECLMKKNVGRIHIVCIGTDKIIGDAYGPLCGSILKDNLYRLGFYNGNVDVYGEVGGTDMTVNATNVNKVIDMINSAKGEDDIVIALDACLSDCEEKLFSLQIDTKAIQPAAGMGKKLNSVGNIGIRLVTNIITDNDRLYFTPMEGLSKVMLHDVYKRARITALGLLDGIVSFYNKNSGLLVG